MELGRDGILVCIEIERVDVSVSDLCALINDLERHEIRVDNERCGIVEDDAERNANEFAARGWVERVAIAGSNDNRSYSVFSVTAAHSLAQTRTHC